MRRIIPLVLVLLSPALAAAQSSVGFSDPDDLEALLSYRLPTWGWRTWQVGFGAQGQGRESIDDRSSFDASARTALEVFRESEDHVWNLGALLDSGFFRANFDDDDDNFDNHLRGSEFALELRGRDQRYVASSAFWVVEGNTRVRYADQKSDQGPEPRLRIVRAYQGFAEAGIGWGRLRSVTPLVRAQRISERLTALGRDPLPAEDVRQLAELLAQRSGYVLVFDRSDKTFWSRVFEILAQGSPFSAYEVLYVRDVLVEQVGQRLQGFEVVLTGQVVRQSQEAAPSVQERTLAGPVLEARWSRNLSLEHQIGVTATGQYRWRVDDADPSQSTVVDAGFARLRGTHLWALADRYLWVQQLSLERFYTDQEPLDIVRRWRTEAESTFSWFVEDRLVIDARVALSFEETDQNESIEQWTWDLGLSASYFLDRLLF